MSVLLVTAAMAKAFLSALGLVMSMPVDGPSSGPLGLLQHVVDADANFLLGSLVLFLAVWAYGLIDALAAKMD